MVADDEQTEQRGHISCRFSESEGMTTAILLKHWRSTKHARRRAPNKELTLDELNVDVMKSYFLLEV